MANDCSTESDKSRRLLFAPVIIRSNWLANGANGPVEGNSNTERRICCRSNNAFNHLQQVSKHVYIIYIPIPVALETLLFNL